MKKYLLLLIVLLIPTSLFAGEDTDRICADTGQTSYYLGSIKISYPGESVDVMNVQKYFHVTKDADEFSQGYMELYYVVNVRSKDLTTNKRAELYSYNCQTKKPTFLLKLPIIGDGHSYYTVDYLNKYTLLIAEKSFGQAEGVTERIVGYDIPSRKEFLDIGWNNKEAHIDGFVDSKNHWYLYFSSESLSSKKSALYQINKKTKKIIKL